jgi:hypothetical protein
MVGWSYVVGRVYVSGCRHRMQGLCVALPGCGRKEAEGAAAGAMADSMQAYYRRHQMLVQGVGCSYCRC